MPFLVPGSGGQYDENLQILGKNLSQEIFRPFAEKRQPRTSLLVKGARTQGDKRVASGAEACRQRDSDIATAYTDPAAILARFDFLLREPFQTL